jgi:hypothetical protein
VLDNLTKKEDSSIDKTDSTRNDFGKDFHKRNRKLAYSAVGTPDYVAPEVQGKSKNWVICSGLHRNGGLVVDGSHLIRNVGRIPAICLRNTQGNLVQDPKLEEIPSNSS